MAALPPPTPRLTTLPTYVFAWLDELKGRARARGAELLDLGIGNPDQPTPAPIVQAITRAYADAAHHGYPPFRGTERFRHAVAGFMRARFGVTVDAGREVLCISGGKEGVAQITLAFTDEHSASLVPDIHYPVHGRATALFGGTVKLLPLRAEHGFLPRLGEVSARDLEGAKLLFLNYPHNPTGAVAGLDFYEEAVAFAKRHGLVLVSDLAYSEITFDGFVAPSVLQVPGAKDVAIELHSFSKSFNMAGSRVGFAVGNPALIDALYAVRTNMGYGTPAAIQEGAVVALEQSRALTGPIAARYQARRDVVLAGLGKLGFESPPPRGSMFVWLRVPRGFTAQQWTEHLIDRAGVVVTPGNAFGPGGEGYFRVSLVAETGVLQAAISRLAAAGIRFA